MVATVNVVEGNGSPVTWSVITAGRYCTTDSHNPGDTYPCVVPSVGYNYSYWKSICLSLSGTYTSISNLRWFTSTNVATNWDLGTGGMLLVGVLDTGEGGIAAGSYQQAAGVQGTSGYYFMDGTNGHASFKTQTPGYANADGKSSASPLVVDASTSYSGTTYTKHIVTQVKLDTDAVQGDKPNETFTWRYDET